MGKSCGVAKRRRKNANPRFSHKSKFAKQKKKLILRQKLKDPLVREGWDLSISKAKNLKEIGITDNPNKVIPVPKPIDGFLKPKKLNVKVAPPTEPKRKEILEKIEERAKRKKPLTFHFGPNLITWLTAMMAKHGDDYKAMERDPDNHYQHSAGFIRRKVKQFLTNPFTGDAYDQAMESIEADLELEEPVIQTEKPEKEKKETPQNKEKKEIEKKEIKKKEIKKKKGKSK